MADALTVLGRLHSVCSSEEMGQACRDLLADADEQCRLLDAEEQASIKTEADD